MRDSINRYFAYVFFDRLINKIILSTKSNSAKEYFKNLILPARSEIDKIYSTVLCGHVLCSQMLEYEETYNAIESNLQSIMAMFKGSVLKKNLPFDLDYRKYILFYMECCHYIILDTFEDVGNHVDNDVKNAVLHILEILKKEINLYNELLTDKISDTKPYLRRFISVNVACKIRNHLQKNYVRN